MPVLFAAGDPGGANALRPIIAAVCARDGHALVMRSGAFASGTAFPDTVRLVLPPDQITGLDRYLAGLGASALCFGTSLNDTVPLRLARAAASAGLGTVAVLDNWVNYRARLTMDGGDAFIPDVYAVMDDRAWAEAVADGVPAHCLMVTGHPNLGSLSADWMRATPEWRDDFRRIHGVGQGADGRPLVVFVNEPVAHDQGDGSDHPGWRGYTERTALAALSGALASLGIGAEVMIIPHPRDDVAKLAALWAEVGGRLPGRVLAGVGGRQAMLAADRVAGMASIMLYESWLVGRPTLSLQPGLVRDDLLSIATRPGVVLARTTDQVPMAVERWMGLPQVPVSADLVRHEAAAETVASLLLRVPS
jgi:hypothetical protein